MSSINERIAAVIQHSGLTKTAFAERLQISQQHVSRLAKDGTPTGPLWTSAGSSASTSAGFAPVRVRC